jgi:hypothetical protein
MEIKRLLDDIKMKYIKELGSGSFGQVIWAK